MNRNEMINKARKEQGMSIRELANKSGVKYNTVRDIVNQTSENPRIDNIEKIARALNINIMENEKNELDVIFNQIRQLDKELQEDIINIIKIWLKNYK